MKQYENDKVMSPSDPKKMNVSIDYDNKNSINDNSDSYHLTSEYNTSSMQDPNSNQDSFILNPPSNNDIMEQNRHQVIKQYQLKNLTFGQRMLNKWNALVPLLFLQVLMLNMFVFFSYFYVLPTLDSMKDNSIENIWQNDHKLATVLITFYLATSINMINYFRTSFTQPGSLPSFLIGQQIEDLDKLMNNSTDFIVQHSNDNKLINQYRQDQENKMGKQDYVQLQSIVNQIENPDILKYTIILDSVEFKSQKAQQGKPRYCQMCESYKPDRSHHCSICQQCVLKMDHHCPFINNCIGFYNYKYFMQMLIYINVQQWLVLAVSKQSIINHIQDYEMVLSSSDMQHFVTQDILITLYLICSYSVLLMLTILLFLFTLWHFYMILNGLSTIEQREKMGKFRNNANVTPFDNGYWENWCLVFGYNPLFWFLPLNANYDGYGLIYKSPLRKKTILSMNLLRRVMNNPEQYDQK